MRAPSNSSVRRRRSSSAAIAVPALLAICLLTLPTLLPSTRGEDPATEEETVTGGRIVVDSISDLPTDDEGRISSHLLVYPAANEAQRQCAESIRNFYDSKEPYGHVLVGVSGDALDAFFPDSSAKSAKAAGDDGGIDGCVAACVERGVQSHLSPTPMPNRRYPSVLDVDPDRRHTTFASWFHSECQSVEFGFINYLSPEKELRMYWVSPRGERMERLPLKYGERNTQFLQTFLGHTFEFVDDGGGGGGDGGDGGDGGEVVVLRHTVEYNGVLSIGELGPYEVRERDYHREIKNTLQTEWSRHKRVTRTFSPLGFTKGRLPDDLWGSIGAFYHNNKHAKVREEWSGKGLFVNWWEVDVYFVQIPWRLKTMWQTRLRQMVQDWVGVPIENTDIYGMRRYEAGARLLTHVDRHATHAASLIVNVAQGNVSEPWPVEVHDHADRLHQVVMAPGDVVYYESAKCLHGRNTPLSGVGGVGGGGHYVNLFSHYRPVEGPEWFEQPNPEGTPEPLIDVGECRLVGAADQLSQGAVQCDDPAVGPHLSPAVFTATSGDDLFDWWRRVGPDDAAEGEERADVTKSDEL